MPPLPGSDPLADHIVSRNLDRNEIPVAMPPRGGRGDIPRSILPHGTTTWVQNLPRSAGGSPATSARIPSRYVGYASSTPSSSLIRRLRTRRLSA